MDGVNSVSGLQIANPSSSLKFPKKSVVRMGIVSDSLTGFGLNSPCVYPSAQGEVH